MSILTNIWTALKGGASEIGESIVDSNAVRIYEQNIREAKDDMASAKRSLTEVMSSAMQAEREVNRIASDIEKYEGSAIKALENGDEALAAEVAEKIADLEAEIASQKSAKEMFDGKVGELKARIKSAERAIEQHERELKIVKTTDSVQRATKSINSSSTVVGSKMSNAKEALERVKRRQQREEDKMKAAEMLDSEMGGDSLDQKLEKAGISGASGADDVMKRIREKAAAGEK